MNLRPPLLLAALALALGVSTARASDPDVGAVAPDWQLQDLDGNPVKLSDLKGKVVVLDFWATWCPPCVGELPELAVLSNQYANRGVAVIGVALFDTKPAVSAFVKSHGIDFPVALGDDTIAAQYGHIQGLPTTFVIDRRGVIADKHEGAVDRSTFEQEINKLL